MFSLTISFVLLWTFVFAVCICFSNLAFHHMYVTDFGVPFQSPVVLPNEIIREFWVPTFVSCFLHSLATTIVISFFYKKRQSELQPGAVILFIFGTTPWSSMLVDYVSNFESLIASSAWSSYKDMVNNVVVILVILLFGWRKHYHNAWLAFFAGLLLFFSLDVLGKIGTNLSSMTSAIWIVPAVLAAIDVGFKKNTDLYHLTGGFFGCVVIFAKVVLNRF